MLLTMVSGCLMHGSVDTGGAHWARRSAVFSSVPSIDGVLLVPSHAVLTRMSCDLVHVVVE